MAKPRVVRAFSAGGVVFRVAGEHGTQPAPERARHGRAQLRADDVEVVLVGYTREGTWMLPKGTPARAETVEQTAVREVREETGIEPRVIGEIGSIHYWFARKGVRFQKEVFHYLMEAAGGDVSLHDAEYDEARWFPLPTAIERLTYENEADVVRRAEPLIMRYLGSGPGGMGGASAPPAQP